jgi:hypothetical protein
MFAPASCLRSPAQAGLSTAKLVIHFDLALDVEKHELPLAHGERVTFSSTAKKK